MTASLNSNFYSSSSKDNCQLADHFNLKSLIFYDILQDLRFEPRMQRDDSYFCLNHEILNFRISEILNFHLCN